MIAAASMGAYVAAARAWAQTGGTASLDELFDEAFGALEPRTPSTDTSAESG